MVHEFKSIDGVNVPLSPEEVAELDARDAEFAAGQAARDVARANAPILRQLADLDARSIRTIRTVLEAQATGMAPDNADINYLKNLKAEADALRAQLVK